MPTKKSRKRAGITFKSTFYFHEISDPLPFLPAITLEYIGILQIFC